MGVVLGEVLDAATAAAPAIADRISEPRALLLLLPATPTAPPSSKPSTASDMVLRWVVLTSDFPRVPVLRPPLT